MVFLENTCFDGDLYLLPMHVMLVAYKFEPNSKIENGGFCLTFSAKSSLIFYKLF